MKKIKIVFFVSFYTANAKPDSLQVTFDHNGGFYTNPFELKMMMGNLH